MLDLRRLPPLLVRRLTPLQDEVLVAGFGRKGHAVGDIPGVRFKIVKVAGVALSALFREKSAPPWGAATSSHVLRAPFLTSEEKLRS